MQIGSLTPGLSFDHNLCCRCRNGSCKAILDIYTSRPFQRYEKHLKARCFDPCNRSLSFRESQRTLKSHFLECEWRPHTSLKVGLPQLECNTLLGRGMDLNSLTWLLVTYVLFQMYTTLAMIQSNVVFAMRLDDTPTKYICLFSTFYTSLLVLGGGGTM
jgi:hypothetical protein